MFETDKELLNKAQTIRKANPAFDSLVKSLAVDIKPVVDEIETGIKTTQGHYGRYMSALHSLVPDQERNKLLAVGLAMIDAGANIRGIVDALKILSGRA